MCLVNVAIGGNVPIRIHPPISVFLLDLEAVQEQSKLAIFSVKNIKKLRANKGKTYFAFQKHAIEL